MVSANQTQVLKIIWEGHKESWESKEVGVDLGAGGEGSKNDQNTLNEILKE